MGVDRTDYLMFAAEMGADDFDYDKHQAEIEGAPEAKFDIVYDGMSGQYALAGKIIAKSDPYEGFEMAKIDQKKMDLDADNLAAKISEAFDQKLSANDFHLILFSHFS